MARKRTKSNVPGLKTLLVDSGMLPKNPLTGGLLTKKSPCCGARVIHDRGVGLHRDICAKCKRPVHDKVYR